MLQHNISHASSVHWHLLLCWDCWVWGCVASPLSLPCSRAGACLVQVGQYSFTLPNASGGADAAYWRYMFPLGDLMNHAGNSNCALGRDFSTGMMYAKAKRAIR